MPLAEVWNVHALTVEDGGTVPPGEGRACSDGGGWRHSAFGEVWNVHVLTVEDDGIYSSSGGGLERVCSNGGG